MQSPPDSLRAERALSLEAGRVGSDRSFMVLAFASLLIHIAMVLVSLWRPAVPSGGGAIGLDTISITIVADRDLAALVSAASGSEPTLVKPSLENSPPVSDPPPVAEVKPKDEPAEPTVREPAATPVREQPAEQLAKEAVAVAQPVQAEPIAPPTAVHANQAPLSIGGQTAGEATASRGEIDRHAREVALVLARHRPKGIGAKGKVVVEFRLSPDDGTLLDVRVTSSSGNERIDRMAVSSIERGKFPVPPKGMRAEQLSFRVPFQFE